MMVAVYASDPHKGDLSEVEDKLFISFYKYLQSIYDDMALADV